MKKTYFEQLSELINSLQSPDKVTEYVAMDCLKRALDYCHDHEEDIDYLNSLYVKRQADFLNQWLNRNK